MGIARPTPSSQKKILGENPQRISILKSYTCMRSGSFGILFFYASKFGHELVVKACESAI
ncbi:hypothetical protein CNECB9_3880008 [Cupriavidus necator]|uniref:Uncharacterized protein n=1 Tax=Cupriavidus necator TaxID=106590 RepID=A0A1K0IJH5_CUPNE|nr:hypothetical protein CNECB9_3880008 [Cupriavidus necator]